MQESNSSGGIAWSHVWPLPVLFLCLFASRAFSSGDGAARVTLAWDASTDREVAGYMLHFGTNSAAALTNAVDAGRFASNTISGLARGVTYYFEVTAYNSARIESVPSNRVPYPVPLLTNASPAVLSASRIDNGYFNFQWQGDAGRIYSILANTDLNTTNWVAIGTVTANVSGALSFTNLVEPAFPTRFYRVVTP